jgi:hypothetical protein
MYIFVFLCVPICFLTQLFENLLFLCLNPTFRTEAVILVNFLAVKPYISLSQEL